MYQGMYNPYQSPQIPQYQPPRPPMQNDFYNNNMQNAGNFSFQPQQQQIQPTPNFTTRAVTGIDEAKAAMIDPIGTHLFTDFNNGKIYVKKINNNGTAEFYSFVHQGETNKSDPMELINARLENIEKILGGLGNVATVDGTKSTGNAKKQSTSVPKGNGND